MKKIVGILFLLVFSFFLVACTGITLATPVATIEGDTLSWDAVEGALQYYVYIDDLATAESETTYYTVSGTSYDLTTAGLADGTYSVYVVAVAGTSFSANSSAVSYVVGDGGGLVLDAPTNVVLTGDVLSWNAVTNATGYTIFINALEVDVTTTSYDLSQENLAAGTYVVYVIATAGTVVSGSSTTVSYVVTVTITLDAPTNVVLTGDVLSWHAVTGASGYVIMVDDDEFPVTATSFDLSTAGLTPGEYQVTVKAVATGAESPASSAVTYTIESTVDLNAIIAGVLPLINEEYSVGMVAGDFDETWEYEEYMQVVAMVTVYANACFDVGLMDADAINFFGDVIDLTEAEGNMDSIAGMLSSTDIFEGNNVTPEVASHLVMTVLTVVLGYQLDGMDGMIENAQLALTNAQADLASLQANTDYVAFLAAIANNAPLTALDTAALFAAGDQDALQLLEIFIWVAEDRQNEIFNDNDYYYQWDIEDEVVDDIIDMVIAVEGSGDAAVLDTINSVQNTMNTLGYYFYEVKYAMEELHNVTMLIDRLGNLETLMTEDAEDLEAAVEIVFEFLFTVHQAFPEEVVTLLDEAISGESSLTTTEIVLIKDEIVALLQDALPSEADFQMFYEAILMLGEVALDNPINDLADHAAYLGSVDYHSANVGLLFLADISTADVGEAMLLFQAIQTTYGVEGASPLENPAPLLDAVEFIQLHLETFIADNATAVADLEALLNADAFEPLYQEILVQLAAVATEQDPEELDMILYILDSLSAEYDNIFNVLGIAPEVVDGLYTAFMDSEASIFGVIASVDNMEDPTLADIVAFMESVIDEVAIYHAVLADQFTQENIESVLSLVIIPAMIESGMYTDAAFEAAVRALIPDVAQVILNVASLEGDAFAALQALVIGDYINETNGFVEPIDVGSALAFIHLFEAVLTTENETLIDDTLDIIFTDILGDATLQAALPIDPLEITDFQTELETHLDEFILAIHTFAAYDIATLTLEQETAIMQFANEVGLFINANPDDMEAMANATVLTEDVVDSSFYRTDELWYSFTPTMAGYYVFTANFDEAQPAYVEVMGEDWSWYGSMWNDDVSIEVSGFLFPSETVYIRLHLEDSVYVDVDAVVSEMVLPELILDTPETIEFMDYETYHYVFTPATDSYLSFVLEGGESIEGYIRIIDGNGNVIVERDFYDYDVALSYVVNGEAGVPIFIEIEPYYWSNGFDLTVSELAATTLVQDVAETVPYNVDAQYFAFTVPGGGPYTIELASAVDIGFNFRYYGNDVTLQNAWFDIVGGESVTMTNFLIPGQVYVIEVMNMSVDNTFDITVSPAVVTSISTESPVSLPVTMYQDYYLELFVEETGTYQLNFQAASTVFISGDIINTDGWYINGYGGDIDIAEGYNPAFFLAPGQYYISLYSYNDVTIDIGVTMLATPDVYVDEDIYIEINGNTDVVVLFTPDVSGEYWIYSYNENGSDPYVTVRDNMGYELGWFDDYEDYNFSFYLYLDSAQTYSFHFNNYDDGVWYYARIELVEAYMD